MPSKVPRRRAIQTVHDALEVTHAQIKYLESHKSLEIIQLRKLGRLEKESKALQQDQMQQQTPDQWNN